MDKYIEDIIISNLSNKVKNQELKSLENDIEIAKGIIDGKYIYCDECKDYFLAKAFFTENKTESTKICVYEDPINSGGNDYVDGFADVIYRACPKGHKHVISRNERRK